MKPVQPASAYLIFQSQIKSGQVEYNKEENKPVPQLWLELPPQQQEIYKQQAKEAYDLYKIQLQKFYEENPAEKEKEEKLKQQRKEKKLITNSLDRTQIKMLEMTDLVMYSLGHLYIFPDQLKQTPKIKSIIKAGFDKLDEAEKEKLQQAFSDMSGLQQIQAIKDYDQWFTRRVIKKEADVKQEGDKAEVQEGDQQA
ncbi:HMG_(High mobility group) box domain-containing protein [Hexamita inflata]|uniref:HMG_(High mobility group) box domain-containing protein n=1 Tax=Hexamita inflata TaxID=28002 RepID=A0ABP1JA16_9EUKA